MDPAAVALLAAGIPAFVAAATFATTQLLAVRSATRQRILGGLLTVAEALEAVPQHLAKPRVVAAFRQPDLSLAFACTRLVLVLPKRDRVLWQWLSLKAEEVANARGLSRVELAAEMQGIVFAYLARRRPTLKQLRQLAIKLDRPDRFF